MLHSCSVFVIESINSSNLWRPCAASPRGRVSTSATKLLLFLMVYLILAYIQKKRKENQSEDENEWELQTAVASSSLIMPSTHQITRSKYKYVLHIREQTEEVFCFLTSNKQGEAGWQVALRLPIKRKFVSAKAKAWQVCTDLSLCLLYKYANLC